MKFGVTLLADDLGTLADLARLAEQIGYDYIGVADPSPYSASFM